MSGLQVTVVHDLKAEPDRRGDELEHQPSTQLHITRLTTSCDLTEGATGDASIRRIQITIIEGVHGIEAQLEA